MQFVKYVLRFTLIELIVSLTVDRLTFALNSLLSMFSFSCLQMFSLFLDLSKVSLYVFVLDHYLRRSLSNVSSPVTLIELMVSLTVDGFSIKQWGGRGRVTIFHKIMRRRQKDFVTRIFVIVFFFKFNMDT